MVDRQRRKKKRMKLLESFKEKKVAVRPIEGFKKERNSHALPTLTNKMHFTEETRA